MRSPHQSFVKVSFWPEDAEEEEEEEEEEEKEEEEEEEEEEGVVRDRRVLRR